MSQGHQALPGDHTLVIVDPYSRCGRSGSRLIVFLRVGSSHLCVSDVVHVVRPELLRGPCAASETSRSSPKCARVAAPHLGVFPSLFSLDVYPYLPKANVGKTCAASYLCLMSGCVR